MSHLPTQRRNGLGAVLQPAKGGDTEVLGFLTYSVFYLCCPGAGSLGRFQVNLGERPANNFHVNKSHECLEFSFQPIRKRVTNIGCEFVRQPGRK